MTPGTGGIQDGTAVGIGTLGTIHTPTAGGGIATPIIGTTGPTMHIGILGTTIPGTTTPGIMILGTALTMVLGGITLTGILGITIPGTHLITMGTMALLCLAAVD